MSNEEAIQLRQELETFKADIERLKFHEHFAAREGVYAHLPPLVRMVLGLNLNEDQYDAAVCILAKFQRKLEKEGGFAYQEMEEMLKQKTGLDRQGVRTALSCFYEDAQFADVCEHFASQYPSAGFGPPFKRNEAYLTTERTGSTAAYIRASAAVRRA